MDQSKKVKIVQRVYTDGSVYEGEGEWNGSRSGNGTYVFSDGSKYVGEWLNNKGHEKGVYTHGNGDVYTGSFVGGVPHGNGIFNYHDGNRFEGSWKNGVRDGPGRYTYVHLGKGLEEFYEGDYKNDVRDGFGVYTYANGDQEEGRWVNGQPHGDHEYFEKEDRLTESMETPLRNIRKWKYGRLSNRSVLSRLLGF
jgi:hypothetical protein